MFEYTRTFTLEILRILTFWLYPYFFWIHLIRSVVAHHRVVLYDSKVTRRSDCKCGFENTSQEKRPNMFAT